MGKSRRSKPKGHKSSGSWGKAIEYAAYRTLMDSAKGDPFKKAGVAMGFGRIGAGSYYLVKGFQQENARRKGIPIPSDDFDPYAALGAAIGAGMLNSTDDLMDFAMDLDAMGAFDPPGWNPNSANPAPAQRNRYAWRLNCEDGTAYGVSPYDYETRSAYESAVKAAKESMRSSSRPSAQQQPDAESAEPSVEDNIDQQFTFCRVSRLDNGKTEWFLSDDPSVNVGRVISIPRKDGSTAQGVILSVETHSRETAPQNPDETLWIL